MDPLIGGALISVGAQLLGGLLGSSAQKEQARKQQELSLLQQGQQLEQAGIQSATAGTTGALGNLVESYRTALLGK